VKTEADMDRRDVQEGWVGRRVRMIPLDERGVSGYELHGWLRGIEEGGVFFEKQFYSDSLRRQMPEKAKFWPWEQIGYLEPLPETE
jgi:hypothetical protein